MMCRTRMVCKDDGQLFAKLFARLMLSGILEEKEMKKKKTSETWHIYIGRRPYWQWLHNITSEDLRSGLKDRFALVSSVRTSSTTVIGRFFFSKYGVKHGHARLRCYFDGSEVSWRPGIVRWQSPLTSDGHSEPVVSLSSEGTIPFLDKRWQSVNAWWRGALELEARRIIPALCWTRRWCL